MTDSEELAVAKQVRVMQIISIPMIAGVLILAGIAAYFALNHVEDPGAPPLPMMTIVAFVMLGCCGAASFIVPAVVSQNAARQIATGEWQAPQQMDPKDYEGDIAKLLIARQAAFIIGVAFLEAAGFMGGIAFLVEAKWYAVAVIVIAVSAIILRFPTEGSVREWLLEQQKQIDEIRANRSSTP